MSVCVHPCMKPTLKRTNSVSLQKKTRKSPKGAAQLQELDLITSMDGVQILHGTVVK